MEVPVVSAWPEPASFHEAPVTSNRYCKTCRQETPHEVRRGKWAAMLLCIRCLRRALASEPDGD